MDMHTLCKLRINGKQATEIDAWVHLPALPVPNLDNLTELVLPVGENEETGWAVCKVSYFGHPRDPGATYVQVSTKPVLLPEAKAQSLIKEIQQKFHLVVDHEAVVQEAD